MLADIPENRLTEAIIQSAIEVHRTLGPGLKEEVYEAALALELGWKGIACKRQVPVQMTGKRVGLVLNFGRPTIREGIGRVFNETREESRARLARENPEVLKRVLVEEDGKFAGDGC